MQFDQLFQEECEQNCSSNLIQNAHGNSHKESLSTSSLYNVNEQQHDFLESSSGSSNIPQLQAFYSTNLYNLSSINFDSKLFIKNSSSEKQHKRFKDEQNEENNQALKKKKGVIQKNKKKKQKKIVGIMDIFNNINQQNEIFLSPQLSITNEGIIRFNFSIGQITFGIAQVKCVSYQKSSQMVEFGISNISFNQPQVSLSDALDYIMHTPCKQYLEASNGLTQYSQKRNYLRSVINEIPVDQNFLQQQDEELAKHIESCMEYIEEYSQQYEGQIFSYAIGRLNYDKKDMEFIKQGYSKSFLDLIGIDVTNFMSILLRQQKIDLIKDKDEVTRLSLLGLNSKMVACQDINLPCQIVTLDGFPIKIYQTKKKGTPNYKQKVVSNLPFEFVLSITDVDVDLRDLENLIEYRQKLLLNNYDLSYDDFIQKELSYLFEDVEYSVHSQSFIEKYYSENIENLYQIALKKQDQKNKRCNYKTSNIQSNHVKIISS